ncbi:ATP-binding protein [Bernardetia sp. ABR2-2B]|uniref:ligand-binding sensor domain-containing protein n=1 Tax=Bernardetia sp. ABR2-2B TaxID=3127472 RepID=UPI0030CE4E56
MIVSRLFTFLVLIFCILWSCQKIQAQDYDLAYQHLTTEDGLSNNFVTAIIQDQKGFIWIGTQEGLNKYDGYSFKVYKSNSEKKYHLGSNRITFLAEDRTNDAVWVGTSTGLSKLHTDRDTIENISFFDKKNINYIYQENQVTTWVATNEGIFKKENDKWIDFSLNLETLEVGQNYTFIGKRVINGVQKYVLVKTILDDPVISTLYWKEKNTDKWQTILETNYNLQYIEKNGKIWTSYKKDHLEIGYIDTYNSSIKTDSIYFDKSKNAKMNSPFLAFEDKPKDNTINDVWFFDTRGLALIDLNTKEFRHWYYWKYFAETMDQYTVETIFRDASQNYWLCTQGSGAFIFADYTINNFRTYKYRKGFENSLSNPSTRAIYQNPKTKTTWIGTYSYKNDIDIFVGDSIKKRLFIDGYAHLIKEDSNHKNILWFATSSGIRKIDKEKFEVLETYRMDKNLLQDILPLNDSTLWVAGNDHLYHFNPTIKKFTSYPHLEKISFLQKDNQNQIWVGSKRNGIGFLADSKNFNLQTANTTEIIYYNPNEKKESQRCYVKHIWESEIEKNIFWIASTTGFYKFDSEKRTFLAHYTKKDGLPNDVVYAILEDEEGNLWGSTNHGIFKFNPKTKTFTNFDKQDGLQDNEFNTFSYFKSEEGELFFGGIGGVNAFSPKDMKKNEFVPPVHLTGFEKLGKKANLQENISDIKEISLPLEESKMLTFHFAALSFYQSNKNKYAYKLEPLQNEWTSLGTKNELTLTNLSAGNYTLHIKGSNNHGVWSKEEITLNIKIIPPFYQTFWFQFLVIALLLIGIYFYYRYKVRESKLKSIKLEKQVKERTNEILIQKEELQITNERLKELDNFKEKTTNMLVHDLKNPLGTIIYEAKNNASIRKASQRMMNLLLALLDSQKIQSPQFQLNVEKVNFGSLLENVLEEVEVFLMEKKIQIIYEETATFWLEIDRDLIHRVLVNLLTNAIKYSSKRSLIKISIQESKLNTAQIIITDNGRGIPKYQIDSIFDSYKQVNAQKMGAIASTGLGLSFCKLAIEAHGENCEIYVDSIPDKETNFHFTVPLLEMEKLTNLPNNSEIKTFLPSNSYHFSKTELHYLAPFIKELNNLEVYQATQIRSILNELNDESTTITKWKNEMLEILYQVDEEQYQKLLNLD